MATSSMSSLMLLLLQQLDVYKRQVVAAATLLNIPLEYIKSGLHRARSSGRMELYTSADKRVTAVVDYAHNKLSFEKLFGSTREEYPDHDIVSMFGCPGYKACLLYTSRCV